MSTKVDLTPHGLYSTPPIFVRGATGDSDCRFRFRMGALGRDTLLVTDETSKVERRVPKAKREGGPDGADLGRWGWGWAVRGRVVSLAALVGKTKTYLL